SNLSTILENPSNPTLSNTSNYNIFFQDQLLEINEEKMQLEQNLSILYEPSVTITNENKFSSQIRSKSLKTNCCIHSRLNAITTLQTQPQHLLPKHQQINNIFSLCSTSIKSLPTN